MDDGYSTFEKSGRSVLTPGRRSRRRPTASHHRRRRAIALGLVGAMALLIGVIVGAASSGSRPVASTHGRSVIGRASSRQPPKPSARAVIAARKRAEDQAIDRTLAYTPYVRIAGAQHREIALTFDDGPGPYTPDVLRQLERLHVPGTFFEVGIEERYFHDGTSEIVARGYPIGDHTENHLPMSELSRKLQASQLLQDTAAIGAYGAPFPRLFRPPYGLWNHTTLSLLHKYRMLMVLWTVDTDDYLRPGVRAIVHSAVSGARPGAIILLHDAGGDRSQTVSALPAIVHDLRARGYKLVSVPRLLLDNPPPKDQNLGALPAGGG